MDNSPTRESDALLAHLQEAGIGREEILAVFRTRVLRQVASHTEAAARLEGAISDCLTMAPPGSSVPAGERWGRGPNLTQTDIDGAMRVLAVAQSESLAAAGNPPLDHIFRGVISGMSRREDSGRHVENLDLIRLARDRLAAAAHDGGVCRVCGCIDLVACEEGCSWVDAEHTLCSRCSDGAGGWQR